jgi:hypothetical protein
MTATLADAAAAKTTVRHRPRHSSRVSASSESAPAKKKKTTTSKKKSTGKTQTPATHKKAPPSTKPK